VVHHALTQVLEPIFEKRFSNHSYACRAGKGTHQALGQAKRGAAQFPYVLKCDVRKYFDSIDHEILKTFLARVVKCRATLDLAARIIDGFTSKEVAPRYFPGDDLFTPCERRRGMPLGNQTSQFFANVYLNSLDRFVEGTLGPGCYVRYVDDFLLFGASKAELSAMKRAIEDFLEPLRLLIHERKSRVYRSADGVTFLGFRLFPGRTRVVRRNVVRFRRRLRGMQRGFDAGTATLGEIRSRIQSWIGHAKAANTRRLRVQLFATLTLVPRSAV
jgi:retron-type reverse transcriptase